MAKDNDAQDRYLLAAVRTFRSHLEDVTRKAQAAALARLRAELDIDERGRVRNTVGNQRRLRTLDTLIMDEMDRAGLKALLNAFAKSFSGQVESFSGVLDQLGSRLKHPLPKVRIQGHAASRLSAQQVSTVELLRGAVSASAESAKRQALLNTGGMTFDQLADVIHKKTSQTVGQAEGLAITAMGGYYRALAGSGYEQIEDSLPDHEELRFGYSGIRDRLNRPFCRRLLDSRRTYTRAEIEEMDNESGLDVWHYCGGFRCRHHWHPLIAEVRASRG